MASLKYWLWLSALPGVSEQLRLALLDHFGEPDGVYYGDEEEYLLVEGMTREAAAALRNRSLAEADRILGECDRLGLRLLTIRDSEYPDRLRNIYGPPLLLYVQGRLPVLDEEAAVAMVGSRRASGYAMEAGEKLAFQLTRGGALVVSGLAAGGDACAHRGALRAGGSTVAVIANGHDVVYPQENRRLYADIAVQGAILSEYPPGTEPLRGHFPARNRIISGVSVGTVIIEAPEKSGCLITAGLALDQGRDVFAIPGHIGDPHCAGSNRLLRDGACVVTEPWDVLEHYAARFPGKIHRSGARLPQRFGADPDAPETEKAPDRRPEEKSREPARRKLSLSGSGLTDDQIALLRLLRDGAAQVDELIDRSGLPARRVLSAMTMLEVDGAVEQSSGKNFTLAVTLVK